MIFLTFFLSLFLFLFFFSFNLFLLYFVRNFCLLMIKRDTYSLYNSFENSLLKIETSLNFFFFFYIKLVIIRRTFKKKVFQFFPSFPPIFVCKNFDIFLVFKIFKNLLRYIYFLYNSENRAKENSP